jgi:hypothetical protein
LPARNIPLTRSNEIPVTELEATYRCAPTTLLSGVK